MPGSDWRSPAAYGHAHSIPAAGFAWEYLRRDDAYRRDFERMKRISRHDTEAQTAFANRWGCDFAADPDQHADRAALFWTPALQPDAFELRPSGDPPGDFAMPIALPGLPGLAARSAMDSAWHTLWRGSGGEHRFWLAEPPPDDRANFVVVLPLDALFELRAEAALRFWLALAGRPPGDRRHDLPAQTRERHILILRALDAKLAGASYRVIAEALLGFRGRSKNDWEVSPLKNKVRRLVADGLFYMRGGYRELLHYPVRLPRRR